VPIPLFSIILHSMQNLPIHLLIHFMNTKNVNFFPPSSMLSPASCCQLPLDSHDINATTKAQDLVSKPSAQIGQQLLRQDVAMLGL
jgi:hypothetical protein